MNKLGGTKNLKMNIGDGKYPANSILNFILPNSCVVQSISFEMYTSGLSSMVIH